MANKMTTESLVKSLINICLGMDVKSVLKIIVEVVMKTMLKKPRNYIIINMNM